jgi:hypothetical protein
LSLEIMSPFSAYVVSPITRLLGKRRRTSTHAAVHDASVSMSPLPPPRDDDIQEQPSLRRARVDDTQPAFSTTAAADGVQDVETKEDTPAPANTCTWSGVINSFTRSYREHELLWDIGLLAFMFSLDPLGIPQGIYTLAAKNGLGHTTAWATAWGSKALAGSACVKLACLEHTQAANNSSIYYYFRLKDHSF